LIAGSGTDNNTVRSNTIGLDRTGTKAVPNGWDGVAITSGAAGNEVGGSGYRNYIGGNGTYGVHVYGSGSDNTNITDNYIGIDANGTGLVPNGLHGVGIYDGAQNNTVSGNVIVGNGWTGVAIVNGSNGNLIDTNAIGTDSAGTATNLGNGHHGVHIVEGSDNILRRNQIAYNGTQTTKAGVLVDGPSATANRITENSIHDNGGKGIELINGGNRSAYTPMVTTASCNQVDGKACQACTVEIFADTADEGGTYLGTTTASPFQGAFTWSGTVQGPNVTVTADDGRGNTSEFSAPVQVGSCPSPSPNPRVFVPIVLRNR
jgi:parallel beta-helix repeat protein